MRLLILPLALSVVLAGCIADATPPLSTGGGEASEATGLAHLAAARALAGAWDGTARLSSVSATEGEAVHGQVDPPLSWNTAADPALGNGKAIVWTYAFSGANASLVYYVSMAGDGTVLYARALPLPYYWHHGTPAVAEDSMAKGSASTQPVRSPPPAAAPALVIPALDSDAAAASAAAYPPFADFAAAHPRHQVTNTLVAHGDGAAWAIVKNTATYFGVAVLVDGASGEILERHEWPSPPPPPCLDSSCQPPPPEPRPDDLEEELAGSAPGRITSGGYVGEVWSATFPVESGYWFRDATVTIRPATLPGEYVWIRLLDPYGQSMWEASGSDVLEAFLPWGQPGLYTLEVRQDGLGLRDVPFTGSIVVRYDEPAWREMIHQQGSLSAWMGPFDLPFSVHGPAESLTVRLRYGEGLPTDGVRYELSGPHGEVEEGGGSLMDMEITVPEPSQGSWRLRVWPQPQTVAPVELTAMVEIVHQNHADCCWM